MSVPPVPPIIRLTVQLARWGAPIEGWDLSELLGDEEENVTTWSGTYELRKLQVRYSRSPAGGLTEDVAVTTHHFLNLTDDAPDASWDTEDYETVEDAFGTFWGAIDDLYLPTTKVDQYRWYLDGPAFHPTPVEGNPAARVTEVDLAGSASGSIDMMPPQVAMSVTERTAIRKRWGRFYLPAPAAACADSAGRIAASELDEIADAVEILYNTCRAADLIPVVFSPTTESAYSVDIVQVDNLFDVIRSRRWSGPTVRDARTLAAI